MFELELVDSLGMELGRPARCRKVCRCRRMCRAPRRRVARRTVRARRQTRKPFRRPKRCRLVKVVCK
ncbi:MAG: hypothetical protein GXN96_01385 [Aquificae bacterium]|nr:hypothetical protein [Aquificota bacterium]